MIVAIAAMLVTATPTAEQLLAAMDGNLTFDSRHSRMVMTVEGRRSRSYELVSTSRGEEDAAIEYVAPARDKGTRMLKLGGELWIFMPSVDKVQKISGHMLRQGMMGSDLSYEDLMTSRATRLAYQASVVGEEPVDGRPCWKLEMVARDDTVAYPRRTTWVDQETFVPLKQELFALSGMLLKTWTMSDVREAQGRRFPMRMTIQDMVRKESVTRIEFKELRFGVALEKETFSLRWLERR
jgi:outer membrane lipoprotein-sorting protein